MKGMWPCGVWHGGTVVMMARGKGGRVQDKRAFMLLAVTLQVKLVDIQDEINNPKCR
jgi:hypothetical protein